MFEKVEAFFKDAIDNGFDVDKFLTLIKEALAAIFGFIEKEETK